MAMLLNFFLCVLVFASVQANDDLENDRPNYFAVDGPVAVPHSHPWIVTLGHPQSTHKSDHNCGGSLLRLPCLKNSSNIVLTAAHCVDDPTVDHDAYFVKAGKHRIHEDETGERKEKVVVIKIHEKYDHYITTRNDIAILKLENPIVFSDTIKPIDLPKYESKVPPGSVCKYAGWGRMHHDDLSSYPDVLHELTVIENSTACPSEKWAGWIFDNRSMMCMIRNEPGSNRAGCMSDSGGPLTCKKNGHAIQEGIVNGAASAQLLCDGNTVFIRVSEFVPWIEEQIKAIVCQK